MQNSLFYLLRIFSGALDHDVFEGHDWPPLDTPLCGAGPKIEWAWAEREKNTVERERESRGVVAGLQKKEAWAEISTAPLRPRQEEN